MIVFLNPKSQTNPKLQEPTIGIEVEIWDLGFGVCQLPRLPSCSERQQTRWAKTFLKKHFAFF